MSWWKRDNTLISDGSQRSSRAHWRKKRIKVFSLTADSMTLLMFWWQSQTRAIKNQRRYACVYLEGFILMVYSLRLLLCQSFPFFHFVAFSEKEIKYWQGFTSVAERVISFILCKHFLRQQQHRLWISRHSFPFLCQSLCETQQFTDSEPIILGYINGPLNAKRKKDKDSKTSSSGP